VSDIIWFVPGYGATRKGLRGLQAALKAELPNYEAHIAYSMRFGQPRTTPSGRGALDLQAAHLADVLQGSAMKVA
jgi:hypothetical protein